MRKGRFWIGMGLLVGLVVGGAVGARLAPTSGQSMTMAAQDWWSLLDEDQRALASYEYDAAERVQWHFIPKPTRKGLPLKQMNADQRIAARNLLRTCLSRVGYDKADRIMELESLLAQLEAGREGTPLRDSTRYFFTVFGRPGGETPWGLSIEGHHLSLNFVIEGEEVVSSTPTFFAANPTIVNQPLSDRITHGTRVLADEELVAFDLIASLDDAQRAVAIIAEEAPAEIRAAGETHAPAEAPAGIAFGRLNASQQSRLRSLVEVYLGNLPGDVAHAHRSAIETTGWDALHFCWAGATQPGIGHYYRVQGPTVLIEFVNTQADAAGNPASHIHCVLRDPRGDFALDRTLE